MCSHCAEVLQLTGWNVVVSKDLSRGYLQSVRFGPSIKGSLLYQDSVKHALTAVQPNLVAHFSAVAYVGESMIGPLLFYLVNMVGSLNLLEARRAIRTGSLLFFGTCAVYGNPIRPPIDEDHPRQPIGPHGISVLELLSAVERARGQTPSVGHAARREGGRAELIASAREAARGPGWRASESGIDYIVATALAWQRGMRSDQSRQVG